MQEIPQSVCLAVVLDGVVCLRCECKVSNVTLDAGACHAPLLFDIEQ